MRRRTTGITVISLLGLLLLTACAAGGAPTNPANPLAASDALPAPAGPPVPREIGPTDSVALAYTPTDGSLLRADREGLFRWRADSGWESIDIPQAFGASGVIVDPDQPAIVYASGAGLGVMRSDDGGANWRAVHTGLPNLDVTALALHSFRRETLYAWVRDDGIYRTEDGGANWKRMPDQGPPDKDVRGLIHSTLPGSMNTGWLYASTPSGAYLSMDCF